MSLEYLDTLNESQKEAVLDTEHNLLLLACAGSGKTRTITSKIAYYIEKEIVKPYEILAVTFTNKAAHEMRERLSLMLPGLDISSMEIRTFHSFGAWVLRRDGAKVGLANNFSIYDDIDSASLLSHEFPTLDKKDAKGVCSFISKAKDFGILPNSGRLNAFNTPFGDNFALYYKGYEDALKGTGNVDFADLILKPVLLFNKFDDIRAKYQRRFKLILVDEYQDSNRMQFELLSLVSSKNSQLCVVGDDDQSIYSFRGADIENILTFNRSFKNVREIRLEKNYRSTSEILALAGSVIKNNKARHKKEIISFDDHHGKKPELIIAQNARAEAENVIEKARKIHDYDNTAIIYRTNAQSLEFERVLGSWRIPYRVVGALKFYEREEVKDALALLRLLVNRNDSVNFRRIINKPPRGLGEKAVNDILSLRDDGDVIKALSAYSLTASAKAKKGAEAFLSAYEHASKMLDEGAELGDLLEESVTNFSLLEYYEKEEDERLREAKKENLAALKSSLSDYGYGRSSLESFLENITLDNSTEGGKGEDERPGVTLITMHNTKGLEFDYVFVAGVEDEYLPGSRSAETIQGVEEERRLFYVAVTRAKKELYLSYANSRISWSGYGDSRRHPSRYLNEIPKDLYTGIAPSQSSLPYSYVGSKVERKWEKKSYENVPAWAKNISLNDKKKEEKKEIPDFELYDSVKSPTYGFGVIVGIKDGEKGHRLLTIKFSALGEVKLNEWTAALSLVKKGGGFESEKSEKFSLNDKVLSPAHGKGKIVDIKDTGSRRILTIALESGKEIKLVEQYASLEKIL